MQSQAFKHIEMSDSVMIILENIGLYFRVFPSNEMKFLFCLLQMEEEESN